MEKAVHGFIYVAFGQYGYRGCIKFISDRFWSQNKKDGVVIYLPLIIRKEAGCKA